MKNIVRNYMLFSLLLFASCMGSAAGIVPYMSKTVSYVTLQSTVNWTETPTSADLLTQQGVILEAVRDLEAEVVNGRGDRKD
jgi:hypothetical protein